MDHAIARPPRFLLVHSRRPAGERHIIPLDGLVHMEETPGETADTTYACLRFCSHCAESHLGQHEVHARESIDEIVGMRRR